MNLARLALGLSLLALIVLLIGGPGYRLGFWGLEFGLLDVMRYALFLGAGAALLATVLLFIPKTRDGHVATLSAAIVVGAAVAAIPMVVRGMAEDHPIHDITTDPNNPPAFVAVAPLRADAPNPPEYPGEETARLQREHYPGLAPLTSRIDPDALFEHARAAARDAGWDIVDAEAEEGRIEASDTTFWYGFTDDIVIRVTRTTDGSRLDVRSKSRVGRSDLGKNAERIRSYLERVRSRLGPA